MSVAHASRRDPGSSSRRHARTGLLTTTIVAVVTMATGTFAPWLVSGTNDRNLYSSAGVVERLAGLGSPATLAIDALPLTGVWCVLALVAYILGRRRIAAGAIAVLGVVLGGIAMAALLHQRAGAIHLRAIGPGITLTGAAVSLAAIGWLTWSSSRRPSPNLTPAFTSGHLDPLCAHPEPAQRPVGTDIEAKSPTHPAATGSGAERLSTMEFK